MSVIVQKMNSENDIKFYLFTKGSDFTMIPKLQLTDEEINKIKSN